MASGTHTTFDPGGLTKTPDFRTSRDKTGLWTARQVFYCQKTLFTTLVPERGDEHPDFDYLIAEEVSVTEEEGKWMKIEVTYYGALGTGGTEADIEAANPPEYTRDITLSEEPLETHPRYVDALAVDDIREAVELAKNPPKEEDGTLQAVDQTGWDALKVELYELLQGGQESYREPRLVYRKRWVSTSDPGATNAGKIQTPDGTPPTLPAGYNWLNAGERSTQRGNIYENEVIWESSGRGGWNTDLYT